MLYWMERTLLMPVAHHTISMTIAIIDWMVDLDVMLRSLLFSDCRTSSLFDIYEINDLMTMTAGSRRIYLFDLNCANGSKSQYQTFAS